MDPKMAEFAMEQMKRMSPEQIQNLTRQMGSMSPAMMQQAMSQMQNMGQTDWERARQQMNSMSPEEMARQAAQASSHLSSQEQYLLNASIQLKNEGNKLHSEHKYLDALGKYERAKSNVESQASAEAKDLRKACMLNLSSCYLNLSRFDECVSQCDGVLAVEPESLKAYYRRGQAYFGMRQYARSVKDLRKAVRLAANDPNQLPVIREKLNVAEEKLEETGATVVSQDAGPPTYDRPVIEEIIDEAEEPCGASPPPAAPPPVASTSGAAASASAPAGLPDRESALKMAQDMLQNPEMAKQVSSMMDSLSDADMARMSQQMGMPVTPEMLKMSKQMMANMPPEALREVVNKLPADAMPGLGAMPAGVPPVGPAGADPEAVKKAAAMMQENPEMIKMAADMMANMSPEQISQMYSQMGPASGMAGMTPEMAKAAAEQLKSLSPDQVASMAKMAASMQGDSGAAAPAAAAAAASRGGPAAAAGEGAGTSGRGAATGAGAGAAAAAAAPSMAGMAELVKNMPPEELAAMAQASGAPAGMAMTPEMAKMAADMMAKMSPEDMARMAEMATQMGGPGGMAGMGGMGGMGAGGMGAPGDMSPEAMAQMTANMDPAMMDQAMSMMRNMDEESLAAMMVSSGMCADKGQAEAMARQMKGMSDSQMKFMMKAASTVQAVALKAQRAKAWAAQHWVLVLSIAVVLVALLLSTLGYI